VPFQSRVPTLFDELSREFGNMVDWFGDGGDAGEPRGFVPRLSVAETEKGYEISADLPGMKPEELDIEIKNGNLWISGERHEEKEENGKKYHRVEQRFGRFQRVLQLGEAVDPDAIKAEYKDGVLHVCVPKTEAAMARRIPITN
jgi:HSP20 family protein